MYTNTWTDTRSSAQNATDVCTIFVCESLDFITMAGVGHTDVLTDSQKLELAEKANVIYRQQLKHMEDHLASLRSLIHDKENIIESLKVTQDTSRQHNFDQLSDFIRTEFAKCQQTQSMYHDMFITALESNSESSPAIQQLRDRLKGAYQFVTKGRDDARDASMKNILKQIKEINNPSQKRSREDATSQNDDHEDDEIALLAGPSAKRRRVDDNHNHNHLRDAISHVNNANIVMDSYKSERDDNQSNDEAESSDLEILDREKSGAVKVEKIEKEEEHDIGSRPRRDRKQSNDEKKEDILPRADGRESEMRFVPISKQDGHRRDDSESESESDSDSDSDSGSDSDLEQEDIVKVVLPFNDDVLKLYVKNHVKFKSYSRQRKSQLIDRMLRKKYKIEFDGEATSKLVRLTASKYYDYPIEYIDVEEYNTYNNVRFRIFLRTYNIMDYEQFQKYLGRNNRNSIQFADRITRSQVFWFRINLPNEGEYKTKRMPLKIMHSKDWTAIDMILDILKLAVDIPLIGYAFFADVIRYITKHELEEGYDYDPNKVDLSLLNKLLDPSRFLIYSQKDHNTNPVSYYKFDRYRYCSSSRDRATCRFEIQFLPLIDPLVTGATEIEHGKEVETELHQTSLTKSVWIKMRTSKNDNLGITRCIISKGDTLKQVCMEHIFSSDIADVWQSCYGSYVLYRCGFVKDGIVSMVRWESMWCKDIFNTLKPLYGYWTIYVPNDDKGFCKYLCGKEYAKSSHLRYFLGRHESGCEKRHTVIRP